MRRVLASVTVLAVSALAPAAATAASGEEQRQINPADQALVESMVLKRADLGRGYKTEADDGDDDGDTVFSCPSVDLSDLTLSGETSGRSFSRRDGLVFVSSGADVYVSEEQAATAWRRGTSKAVEHCFRVAMRAIFRAAGFPLASFRTVAFPRLAEASHAYRAVGRRRGVGLYLDLVVLKQSRALSYVLYIAGIQPLRRGLEVRLASLVEQRMVAAMQPAPPAPQPAV